MEQRIVLKFMDGHEEGGLLAHPFRPRESRVEVVLERDGSRHSFPLEELSCLFFAQKGHWSPAPGEDEFHEEVETIHGDRYPVRTFGETMQKEGFFAFPLDKYGICLTWRSIFFARHGIRHRRQRRLLGNILEQRGLVTPSVMEEAETAAQ